VWWPNEVKGNTHPKDTTASFVFMDRWAAEIANQTSHDIDEVTLPLQDTYHKAHVTASYVIAKKSGHLFRVGLFLDFVRRPGTTRAEGPHRAHVRGARRNRTDRCSRIISPLSFRYNNTKITIADADGTRHEPFNSTPDGGQFDFVWLPARTPRGAYVW
jgi:hypothetical protein